MYVILGFKEPLVRPFRNPVDPEIDGAPGYFEKITNPMDLATMKCKMDLGEYASDQEFIKDMRQMFANCRTYWPAKHELQERCNLLENRVFRKYYRFTRIAEKQGLRS